MGLFEGFEHWGYWFLPYRSDDAVPGRLVYRPGDELELELSGAFDGADGITDLTHCPPLILGVADQRKRFTLHRCTQTGVASGSPGPTHSVYRIQFAIRGAHVEDAADLRFAQWATRFANFGRWVGATGLKVERKGLHQLALQYRRPDERDAGTVAGVDLRIEFAWSFSHSGIGTSAISLDEEPQVRLDASASGGRTIEELLPIQRRLQDFLTIAMVEPTFPTAVNALLIAEPRNPVEVYYTLPRAPTAPKAVMPGDMLFRLADLGTELPRRMERWFQRASALEPIYALYFGTLYNPLAYQEQRYLAFAQAIESYHRCTRNHPVMPRREFRRLRNIALRPLPEDLRDSVIERCGFMNELNLHQRLTELLAEFSEVGALLPTKPDAFVRQVVLTRNYYTHYSEVTQPNAATGESLFRLTQQLRVLLVACFLFELGFASDEVVGFIRRNRRLRFDLGVGE